MLYVEAILISLAMGFSITLFVVMALRITHPEIANAELWDHDRRRKLELRHRSKTYRYCQPLIDELALLLHKLSSVQSILHRTGLQKIVENGLSRGGYPLQVKPAEFLAVSVVQAIGLCTVTTVSAIPVFGHPATIWIGLITFVGWLAAAIESVHSISKKRVTRIKARLPFAIDLIALAMKSGAVFAEALTTAAIETGDHPLGTELRRIDSDVNLGKSQHAALRDFCNRICDADISEIVLLIADAIEQGAPLSDTLLQLADSMRTKREQQIEAQIHKSKTMTAFPITVTLFACMILTLAIFLLPALHHNIF
ncbi:MAG: type II secretion system F family protein [Pirellulaceae bacterium]